MRGTLIIIRSECEGSAVIMREMLIVILNGCEGSIPVVRQAVSCHQSNRFFTPCHGPVFCFFHTAFLRPFRMTIGGKGVIMRETLSVILNECEGSITVVRKAGMKIKAISCELSAAS